MATSSSTSYRPIPQQEQTESEQFLEEDDVVDSSSNTTAAIHASNNNHNSNNSNNGVVMMYRSRMERLEDKLVAAFWILLAHWVARWTLFYQTLWWTATSNNTSSSTSMPWKENVVVFGTFHRILLYLSYCGFAISLCLVLYLMVYLPLCQGLKDYSVWKVYCPNIVPTLITITIISYTLWIRALWPFWNCFTPIVTGIQIVAVFMTLHFIPTCGWC